MSGAGSKKRSRSIARCGPTLRPAFPLPTIAATFPCATIWNAFSNKFAKSTVRSKACCTRGIVRDAAFRRKKPANVRQTFAAKCVSAAALIELTRQDPLRHFVAFSSVSGRFGMTGQADYAAANELLCKQIDSLRRQRPECRSAGIHWHAWDAAGLAKRPELQATFASLDIKFMPPGEGIEHLIRELECGLPESEVVFTSIETCRKQYPLVCIIPAGECEETLSTQDAAPLAGPPHEVDAMNRRQAISGAPLIATISEHRAGQQLTAEIRLDPVGDPFLAEHLLGGKPLLPFVMTIESVAQAARSLCGDNVDAIEDVQIHNGVSFPDGQPQAARVHVETQAAGKCRARLTREFRDRAGRLVDPARLCVTANIECGSQPKSLDVEPPGTPPLGWFPMLYPDDAPIFHGPKFRCLKQVAIQYDGAFGQIVAPPIDELGGTRDKCGWILPAAALDGCLMLCSTFAYFQIRQAGLRFQPGPRRPAAAGAFAARWANRAWCGCISPAQDARKRTIRIHSICSERQWRLPAVGRRHIRRPPLSTAPK